jgi:hypothetical protein
MTPESKGMIKVQKKRRTRERGNDREKKTLIGEASRDRNKKIVIRFSIIIFFQYSHKHEHHATRISST